VVEIVDSTAKHTKELIFDEQSKIEANAVGLDPNKILFQLYRKACYRKTAILDNIPVAMWGIHGTPISLIGNPYFETGLGIEKIPKIRLIKIYKQEIEVMRKLFPVLLNYVQDHHHKAISALKSAGFEISDPEFIDGSWYRKYQLITKSNSWEL